MTLTKDGITGELKISGMLDIDAADSLRGALLDCFAHQTEVAADLSEVLGCDTAALQVLLAAHSTAAALGKPFRVTAASSSLWSTAAALGFTVEATAGAVLEENPHAA